MKDKKVIIYIGNFELPDKNAAAQRVIANGKIFRDLGYTVVFVGVNKNITSLKDKKHIQHGFDVWETPYPNSKLKWLKQIANPIGLDNVIKQYSKDSLYAVICYNYPAISQYKIKRICKKNHAFLIPDITEWPASSSRGIIKGTIKALDTYLRMKLINFHSDALITTSPFLTNYYKKRIPNILELPTLYDADHINSATTPNAPTKQDSGTKFLYAGSPFNPNTNKANGKKVKDRLDIIISLFGKMNPESYTFNIYGITKNDYLKVYPEHKRIIIKHKKSIVFHGRKPHLEILEQIKFSDFTIFFRDIDRVTQAGFPSKFSESITCGTPVVTNLMSNIEPHIVEGRNSFIIDLSNNQMQLEKMNNILSLEAKDFAQMKEYCIKSKQFDYRRHVQEARKFFDQLVYQQ